MNRAGVLLRFGSSQRMQYKDLVIIAAFAIIGIAPFSVPEAEAQQSAIQREDQLKAAYLFNFVKFVEWPAAVAAKPLTVCFFGGQSVHQALNVGIESKTVNNKPLYLRVLEPTSTTAAGCSVLYTDAAMAGKWHLPPSEESLPILTVSDAAQFTRNGGMIELFTESNRLRFKVNVDNAQKVGLRISSSLLQLAASVEKGTGK